MDEMNEAYSETLFRQKYTRPWRAAVIVLLALLYAFIFGMSSRSAAETDGTSAKASDPVISAVFPNQDELSEGELAGIRFRFAEYARTAAHALEYCALGALWFFALLSARRRQPWRFLLPLGLGVVTGLLDECFQKLLGRGRTFQLHDLLVDTAGALVGVAAALGLWMLIRLAMDDRPRTVAARRRVSGTFFALFWAATLIALFVKVPLVRAAELFGAGWYHHEAWYAVMVLFFGLYLLSNLRFRFHKGLRDLDIAVLLFLALFLGAVVFRFLKGETGARSAAGTVAWFLPLLCGAAAYYVDDGFDPKPFAASLAAVAAANALCVLAQWYLKTDFFGMAMYSTVTRYGGQYPGFQITALDSGMLSCYLLAWSLWALMNEKRWSMIIVSVLSAVIAILAIWYSKTRNVFVTAACLLVMLVLYRCLRGMRIGKAVAIVLPVAAAACYGAFSWLAYAGAIKRIVIRFPVLSFPLYLLSSTIERVSLWLRCFEAIPQGGAGYLLLGHGISQATEGVKSIQYSDSVYIDMVWICGIIGLMLFLYLLARVLLRLLNGERQGTERFPLYAMASSVVFAGCFNILTHTQCAVLFLALCCMKSPVPAIEPARVGQDSAEPPPDRPADAPADA